MLPTKVRLHFPVEPRGDAGWAQIAQLVEQGIENPRVGGSIPSLGTPAVVRMRNRQERRHLSFLYCAKPPYRKERFREPTWNELRGLSAEERQLVIDYFKRINAQQ